MEECFTGGRGGIVFEVGITGDLPQIVVLTAFDEGQDGDVDRKLVITDCECAADRIEEITPAILVAVSELRIVVAFTRGHLVHIKFGNRR